MKKCKKCDCLISDQVKGEFCFTCAPASNKSTQRVRGQKKKSRLTASRDRTVFKHKGAQRCKKVTI